ncbi:bifunctional (p)ppGpp synthetase/guanosine-3',5'-bis(diphosphate) 3'-pyrophosphohydrolase [Patescibacteria group bacterium]|nr:bifunctional (p)ppGpp synthetase/guanosine-3',5'-bis(diphosphate) 3'-pyrophosphohydrolase [Patescibacteria group bacterium]
MALSTNGNFLINLEKALKLLYFSPKTIKSYLYYNRELLKFTGKGHRPLFQEIASTRLYSKELRQVILAYRLAKYGYRGKTRLDRTRYFDHTKAVALIIMLEFYVYHRSAIICGLLHDIKEGSHILTWRNIIKIFGKDVCRGLKILTKEDIKDYFHGIEMSDWWIILVKFADRLHNIRTALTRSEKFRRRQLEETERVFFDLLPILEKKLPAKYLAQGIPNYIRRELSYACNRIRKSLDMPTKKH